MADKNNKKSEDFERNRDFCKFISETNRNAFENRKRHEWRLLISVLTFYVLAIALKLQGQIRVPEGWVSLAVPVAFVAAALLFVVFLFFTHAANTRNKDIAHRAEHFYLALCNGNDPFPEEFNKQDLMSQPFFQPVPPAVEKGCWLCRQVAHLKRGCNWNSCTMAALVVMFALLTAVVQPKPMASEADKSQKEPPSARASASPVNKAPAIPESSLSDH